MVQSEFYTNGADGFDYIVKCIDEAKTSIRIQMFIWRDDELGRWIGEALLRAAERGVLIHISKDMVGGGFEYAEENRKSFFYESLPPKLKFMEFLLHFGYPMKGKPQGYIRHVLPVQARKLMNHPGVTLDCHRMQKDHSKYLVIDEELLIISGMNFEFKEWKHDLLGRPYHDYMISFYSSEIVEQFEKTLSSGGDCKRNLEADSTDSEVLDFIANSDVSGQTVFNVRESLINRISQAKESILIVMAYIGDQIINEALVEKAEQGVSITLYIPAKANLQNDLNRKHIRDLMEACGSRMCTYLCHDMIHGKLMVIDDHYVSFGSANLNVNAMDVLKETNVGFYLDGFGHREKLLDSLRKMEAVSAYICDYKEVRYNKFLALGEELISS